MNRLTQLFATKKDSNGKVERLFALPKFTPDNNFKPYLEKYNIIEEELDDNLKEHICINKLGQYEDIDEKLGLPYPIFYEAFFNGVDYLDDSGQIIRSTVNIFDLYLTERKEIAFITKYGDRILLFKDYGKTWALNKEELKNVK